MNKKSLKKIVKMYFTDNFRLLGIFLFIFILTNFLFLLGIGESSTTYFWSIVIAFVLVVLFLYWKVFYLLLLAYSDIRKNRITKKNVKFKEINEDKSWILWNSNPKNTATCKYLAMDEENNVYRLATTCSYQNIKAVSKFVCNNNFRIVKLEKSKLVICIQSNPADFKDKKEGNEVSKTTKNLFGPFTYNFNYKEND